VSALDTQDVADHLNISDTAKFPELAKKLASAQSKLEKRVGLMERTTVTVRVTASGVMQLPYFDRHRPTFPATEITSITPVGGTAVSVVALTVDDINAVRGATFSGTYDVVYVAGYSPLPDDLAEALREMTRHLWTTQRGGSTRPGAAQSDQLSNSLPSSAKTLPFRVEQLITDYEPNGFA